MGENLADVLNSIEVEDDTPDAEEEFIDPDAAIVTKVKRWDKRYWSYNEFALLFNCSSSLPSMPFDSPYSSFDLGTPISIKEAIFALDYIDHDFYVFRDEETKEVSVVYKRNAGGVGLIQPE